MTFVEVNLRNFFYLQQASLGEMLTTSYLRTKNYTCSRLRRLVTMRHVIKYYLTYSDKTFSRHLYTGGRGGSTFPKAKVIADIRLFVPVPVSYVFVPRETRVAPSECLLRNRRFRRDLLVSVFLPTIHSRLQSDYVGFSAGNLFYGRAILRISRFRRGGVKRKAYEMSVGETPYRLETALEYCSRAFHENGW